MPLYKVCIPLCQITDGERVAGGAAGAPQYAR